MIIVLGTGRCGTSTVARLLHTELGVHMGERFRPPDPSNPRGFWEDLDFVDLNDDMIRGVLAFPAFIRDIAKLVQARHSEQGAWGIKDPRLANLLGCYLPLLPPAEIIYCSRNTDDTVASVMRVYGFAREQAEQMVGERRQAIENYRRFIPMTEICFDSPRDDEALIEELANAIRTNCAEGCNLSQAG